MSLRRFLARSNVFAVLFLLVASGLPVVSAFVLPTASMVPSGREALEAPVALGSSPSFPGYTDLSTPTDGERISTTIAVSGSSDPSPLRAYLAAQGIAVDAVPGMTVWLVNGTVASFDRAFATGLASYRSADGQVSMSFTKVPSVPDGLPVVAVAPPDNLLGIRDEIAGHQPATATDMASVKCPAPYQGTLSPTIVEKAYNITPVYQQGYQGQGETIGIVDAYDSAETADMIANDALQFSTCYGLPTPHLQMAYPIPGQNLNSSPSSGWGLETVLDTQWSHATAPLANIVLALAPNSAYGLYFSVDWLVATRAVNVISLSWGEPEFGIYNFGPCSYQCNASSDGSMATLGPVFAQAAAEGMDIFVASGDCGANGGTQVFSPWYPASDPHAVGVGGTVLHTTANGSYSTEYAWNGTETLCANGGGSGGGFSQLPRPTWQTGPGFGRFTNSTRGVPDVALTADVPLGIIYNGSPLYVEGTSDAAPQWAGMGALIAEELGGGNPGFLPPSLYRLLDSPAYAQDFHPVTNGSNGFQAGYGWDPLTGIGTPNFANLLQSLKAAPPTRLAAVSSLTLAASTLAGVAPEPWIPLPVNLSVTPWNGTATPQIYQFYFGDVGAPYQESNASTTTHPWTEAKYTRAGAYVAWAAGYGAGAAVSMSNPLVINVGNLGPLATNVSATPALATAGDPVTFTASASGGVAPYRFSYFFGDGTYASGWADNGTTISHTYESNGTYLVTTVSNDSSTPMRGGWATTCIVVGNSTTPCPTVPRSLVVSFAPNNSTLIASSVGNLMTVQVTYGGVPLSGAQISLASPFGTFGSVTGVTDTEGTFQTVYTAPDLPQSLEYPLYANVTMPGYLPGVGLALVLVNPRTGPSIVPDITLDQPAVLSGASDGVLVNASVAYSGLLLPNASVHLATAQGSVTPGTGRVNQDGLLVGELFAPMTSWSNGSVIATASFPGYTTDSTAMPFTVLPGTGGTRVLASSNNTTLASMASAGFTIQLQTPGGQPAPGPFGSVKGTAADGTFSEWKTLDSSEYTVAYSSPPTFVNASEVLSFNVTSATGSGIAGSAFALENVTSGEGPLLVQFSTDPTTLRPNTNGTLIVTLASKEYPTSPVAFALVVVNLDLGRVLSQNVQWSNAWGRAIFNYSAPNYTGVVPVAVLVIGFVYRVFNQNFSFTVNFPPSNPSVLPRWALWGLPVLGLGAGGLVCAVVYRPRRRDETGGLSPPSHLPGPGRTEVPTEAHPPLPPPG